MGIEAKLAECFVSAPGLQHKLSSSSLVSEHDCKRNESEMLVCCARAAKRKGKLSEIQA